MTGVLILQQPSSSSPVDHWLLQADPRADLTLITGPRSVRRGEYAEGVKVVEAKDYFSPETMTIAYDEAQAMGADRIVSNAEQDVLRVAEIRDALCLPGMSARTALAFRDKLMMKRLFANAGLGAAPASAVRCVGDIVALTREHGRGVVKPLDGMGAKGLVTIDADARHADVLAAVTPVLDDLHAGRLMWEKYVVGDGLHCDVTLSGSGIKTFSVSRTLAPPGAYATHNYTSYTLDKSDPTYPEARRCVEHLVESLPRDHGATMLHFELFESPNGSGVTAGEVGARMGAAGFEPRFARRRVEIWPERATSWPRASATPSLRRRRPRPRQGGCSSPPSFPHWATRSPNGSRRPGRVHARPPSRSTPSTPSEA